jgi:transposase
MKNLNAASEAYSYCVDAYNPGLLADIVSQKFLFSMPLCRMEGMFKQMQVNLPRTTLARWTISAANFLEPLSELMKMKY